MMYFFIRLVISFCDAFHESSHTSRTYHPVISPVAKENALASPLDNILIVTDKVKISDLIIYTPPLTFSESAR